MPLIRKDAPPETPSPLLDPLSRLKSADGEERWTAARSLAKMPESARQLGEALAVETEPRVREALLTTLSHIQTQEAVAAILPLLRSDDAAIRTGALDALNAMPAAVEVQVAKLLSDPDADIRLLVCDTVRRLPSPAAARYLCDLLERETTPNVCAAAVEALCEVGDAEALPVLARCAARFAAEPFLVFSIQVASQRIGGNGRARDPLNR